MKALTYLASAAVATVAAVALCSSAAMAVPITSAGTIVAGDLPFSNFTCSRPTFSGTASGSCGGLDVSFSGGELQISGLVGSGANGDIDFLIGYDVTSASPNTGI